jgi:hypothetical protein
MPEDPNLIKETDEVKPETEIPAQPIVEPAVVKPEETVDFWKQKFADSSREAQLLVEAEKQRQAAQQESTKEPTDSDLRTAFPEWDLMSDTEKRLATRTLGAERIAGNAAHTAQELQAERSWNTSIELVLASNTALQGKEQAFRQYASKPQYKGVPMEVLVDAFLQKNGSAPAPTPKPSAPTLLTGNGGPRTPEKPQHISATDLAALRKSDEKAYMDYVRTHDIDVDNL